MAGLPGAIFLYRLAQRRLMERWLFGVQRGRLMRRNGKPEHERSFYGSGGDRKSTIELPPPDQRDLTSGRCCHRRSSSSGSNGCAQRGAKLSVMLDVPLATHGFTAGFAAFGIKQYPFPPSSRLGADTCIVLSEASFEVGRPANICTAIIFASASQHINEKEHLVL